jgi:hypothetical protein
MTAAAACIILCTLLPFLPGQYDSLAVPLSAMSQILGMVGLSLVPVGTLWVAFEYWRPSARQRYGFAVAALIVSSLVCVMVSLGVRVGHPVPWARRSCPVGVRGLQDFIATETAEKRHAIDLLHLTTEELKLEQTRGHYAVYDAPQPHWKYFRFD